MNAAVKIFCSLFIGIVLSAVAYKILSKGLSNYNIHRYPRLEEIFVNNTFYDVIFLGSSRTHTTVYPSIVNSVAGLSSYNAGTDGGGIYDIKMVLDGYLLHHPSPKMVVLNVDPWSFDNVTPRSEPCQYFPFLSRNKFIEKGLASVNKNNLIKYAPFIGMTSMDDETRSNAIWGLFGRTELMNGLIDNKGFRTNGISCIDTTKSSDTTIYTQLKEEAIKTFLGIIDTCKRRNIELIITYSPEYRFTYQKKFTGFNDFINLIKKNTEVNKLPLYRDDSLPMNQNPCYFVNSGHTNAEGSIAYSTILGNRIKKLLSVNPNSSAKRDN